MKAKGKATNTRKPKSRGEKVQTQQWQSFCRSRFPRCGRASFESKLATKIAQLIEKKGWTQAQTAERTALDQPKVSRLLRGQLSGFQRIAYLPF